jgi:hypothetical protein
VNESEGLREPATEAQVKALPLLTASRLKDARACQRLHKHRYLDGYVPTEDVTPLRFGSMFHRALEAWWTSPDRASALDLALATVSGDADPFESAMAKALIIGYDTRWMDQALTVLAVEQEFRGPLVNPTTGARSRTWELGGKIDAIARDGDGRTLIVEHKTTTSDIEPGGEYWKRLRLDGQVSIYFEGASTAGYAADACLYDVIRKPQLRPLKATPIESRKYTKQGALYANQREADETPAEYFVRLCAAISEAPANHFQRGEVVRLDAERTEAMFDVWSIGRQIREAELAGRFPRNDDACVRYGRTCAFFSVCCGEASLDDPALFRKVAAVHQELSTQNPTH